MCGLALKRRDKALAQVGHLCKEAFNGLDPLPVFREKLEGTQAKLLAIQEHLRFLRIDVELREPLPEELEELRGWREELPATHGTHMTPSPDRLPLNSSEQGTFSRAYLEQPGGLPLRPMGGLLEDRDYQKGGAGDRGRSLQ